MKLSICDIGGEIVKDNETYILKDNKTLKNLVVSSTMLHPGKSTRGHLHEGQEEVYYFVSGTGYMELIKNGINEMHYVKPGDVVLIEDGVFHKVYTDISTNQPLYFVCVFDGKRNH